MSDPNTAIFDALFKKSVTQAVQEQPTITPPVQQINPIVTTPIIQSTPSFNLFDTPKPQPQLSDIDKAQMFQAGVNPPWEPEEELEEEIEEDASTDLLPDEQKPSNTFSFAGIPGFESTTPQPQSNPNIMSIFSGGGSETIVPPVKRGRGRPPKNPALSVDNNPTPQNIVNQMPFNLGTQQENDKSTMVIATPSLTPQSTGSKVILEFDAEKILQISEGLQVISRALSAIANARLSKS